MELRFLTLLIENFKSFRGKHSFTLARPAGLYFINGYNQTVADDESNGAGKSTILDAILWVLTNRTVRAARPGSDVESWSLGKDETVRVMLSFKRDGASCAVERTRHPNSLRLNQDGGWEEATDADVERVVGLSANGLLRTILAGQFGDLFLDLPPEKQAAFLTETLDHLDLWLRAADRAAKERLRSSSELRGHEQVVEAHRGQAKEAERQLGEAQEAKEAYARDRRGQIAEKQEALRRARESLERLAPKAADRERQGKRGASESSLVDIERTLDKKRNERRDLERQHAEGSANLRALQSHMLDTAHQCERYEKARGRCPECGQEVDDKHIRQKLVQARDLHEELKTKHSNLLVALNSLDKRIKALDGDITDREEQVREERKRKAKIGEEREAKREKIDQANAQVVVLAGELAIFQGEVNPHAETVRKLDVRLEVLRGELRASEDEAKDLAQIVEMLDYWVTEFRTIRLDLMDEALAELEITVSRHVESLGLHGWAIRFTTERETKKGDVKYGFTTMLYPPNQSEPVSWESYSGGEDQRWKLACTFGLSEIVLDRAGVNPNIEFLDEPTHHVSQRGVDELLECLAKRARDTDRAIYLIDHTALDRGAFSGMISVYRDERGSRIEEHSRGNGGLLPEREGEGAETHQGESNVRRRPRVLLEADRRPRHRER